MEMILLGIGSIILFYLLKYLIIKNDNDNGIKEKKIDNFFIILFTVINNLTIHLLDVNVLQQIILTISFSILLICAYTDYKTNFVYRIYSFPYIFINCIYIFTFKSILLNDKYLLALVFYSLIIYVFTVTKCFGKGDTFILVGNSFLLITLVKNSYFPIEILLWHFIISVILLIILNIRQMDFRKWRFKKPVAFVPYIYLGTLLIIILKILKI